MSHCNPHKGRGGSRHVGRTRIRAAKILSDALGWEVFPEEIKPATGSWRTDWRLDVYRWELFTYQNRNPKLPFIAGCWDTLTKFVKVASKVGCHVSMDEIWTGPKQDQPGDDTWNHIPKNLTESDSTTPFPG